MISMNNKNNGNNDTRRKYVSDIAFTSVVKRVQEEKDLEKVIHVWKKVLGGKRK